MFTPKKRSTYLQLQTDKDQCPSKNYSFIKRLVNSEIMAVLEMIENMDAEDTTDSLPKSRVTSRPLGLFRTEWPTRGTINRRNGLKSIEAEAKAWSNHPLLKHWVYHADFISLHKNKSTDIYTFEVQWSIPTPAYPVPQVTVSVYFYVAADRNHPPHFPVNVTYVLEGHQFAHNLHSIFRPKWLYDVLDMKTMIFKTFDF